MKFEIAFKVMYILITLFAATTALNHLHEDVHVSIASNYGLNATKHIELNPLKQSYTLVEPGLMEVGLRRDYLRLQSLTEIVGYYAEFFFLVSLAFIMSYLLFKPEVER